MSQNDKLNIQNEIKIHMKLDSPYIIKLIDYFQEDNSVFMILEYAVNGNLFNYLNRKKNLPLPEIKKLFFQTVIGIEYIHQREIVLRDLKPENLLLDENMNIKSKFLFNLGFPNLIFLLTYKFVILDGLFLFTILI